MAIVKGNPNCITAIISTPEETVFCNDPTGHTLEETGEDFDCCPTHKQMLLNSRTAIAIMKSENTSEVDTLKQKLADMEERLKKIEEK